MSYKKKKKILDADDDLDHHENVFFSSLGPLPTLLTIP